MQASSTSSRSRSFITRTISSMILVRVRTRVMSSEDQVNLENVKEVTDLGHKLQISYQKLFSSDVALEGRSVEGRGKSDTGC